MASMSGAPAGSPTAGVAEQAVAGSGGASGSPNAAARDAGNAAPATGAAAGSVAQPGGSTAPSVPAGSCCASGKCLCRGAAPTSLSAEPGPYGVMSYALTGAGCVYYPTGAEPPFAAVAIADGFGGSGGCDSVQTGKWGPLYASHAIVALIVDSGSGAQPNARGHALGTAITALKAENDKRDSPLFGKLAGRYGTAGFSNGGGGSTFATQADSSLLSSIAIMPWGPLTSGVRVPTLVVCGASDGIAPCTTFGKAAYAGIDASVAKLRVTVTGGHNGQPGSGPDSCGAYALAFQKVFLDGDERWRPLLAAAKSDETTIH